MTPYRIMDESRIQNMINKFWHFFGYDAQALHIDPNGKCEKCMLDDKNK